MKVPVSMIPPTGSAGAGIVAIVLLGILVFAAVKKAQSPQPQQVSGYVFPSTSP